MPDVANRCDARLRTALRVDVAAEDAILKEAERGGYDLIVLGVTRRPGETLFFGNMAATMSEQSRYRGRFCGHLKQSLPDFVATQSGLGLSPWTKSSAFRWPGWSS